MLILTRRVGETLMILSLHCLFALLPFIQLKSPFFALLLSVRPPFFC